MVKGILFLGHVRIKQRQFQPDPDLEALLSLNILQVFLLTISRKQKTGSKKARKRVAME